MAKTRFARFYKCDLQLQTPGDHVNWRGDRLPDNPTEGDLKKMATDYIAACYEVGLEVIGITDHNLGGDLGLRVLDAIRIQAKTEVRTRPWELVVLPGFEITISAPGNAHFLCLFGPDLSTDETSHRLSRLKIEPSERKAGAASLCTLKELLVEVSPESNGVVIAAHANRDDGALDDKKVADVWQKQVVTDPNLLCMELPKPRDYYEKTGGKERQIVDNTGDWRRANPIAVINSSDNKRVRPPMSSGDGNGIGARHTWIKMSTPSIEGLRQAFLDHESRIAFGPNRPEDIASHPRIERITISGARFLDDRAIDLSPNLNALIGGGGTGKSTILEYVRAVTGQPPTTGDDVRKNHREAVGSLGQGQVTLRVRRGNEVLELPYPADQGDLVSQVEARFPIVALSQREAFSVASDPAATLDLIDRLQHDRIDELRRLEQRAATTLAELDLALSSREKLLADQARVEAELARERASLAAVEQRRQPLAIFNQHLREQQAVETIDAALAAVADRVAAFAEDVVLGTGRSGFRQPDTPHAEAVDALLERSQQVVATAASTIADLAEELTRSGADEEASDERAAWRADLERAQQELAAAGPDPGGVDPEPLRQRLMARTAELAALGAEVTALDAKLAGRPAAESMLHEAWATQVSARKDMAERLRSLGARAANGEPYVEVRISEHADIEPLYERLAGLMDKRSFGTDGIHRLCEAAKDAFPPDARVAGVVDWIDQMDAGSDSPELEAVGLSARNREHIVATIDAAQRRDLRRLRLPDVAEVILRRKDGTVAGTLDKGLSVGQKCTAILALALAAGTDPILIDQPEDEIDNDFIYTELVPLLRKAKNSRQIIITTHNPNLPVNGDAELIYALQAVSLPGGEARGSKLVEGSLDQPKVREAVERIMEGSREAFDRRRAKYGY